MLSLGGLGLSSYLTTVSFIVVDLSYCEPLPFLSCEAVIYSPYARVFGIPVALVGALGFAALFVISYIALVSEEQSRFRLDFLAAAISVLGLAFGIYLNYLEFIVIRSLCILCLVTFLLVVPMVVLSLRSVLSPAPSA